MILSLRNPSSARPACGPTWDFHRLDIFIAVEWCCVPSLQGAPAYRAALRSPHGDAARVALGFFPLFLKLNLPSWRYFQRSILLLKGILFPKRSELVFEKGGLCVLRWWFHKPPHAWLAISWNELLAA